MIGYKKILHCISVSDLKWEWAIAVVEFDEEKLLRFNGKCRVPEVTTLSIQMTTLTTPPALEPLDAVTDAAQRACTSYNINCEEDAYTYSWYARHNCTGVQDNTYVAYFDHSPYVVGEMKKSDKWDENPEIQCSHGIHLFLTLEEAENYWFW